MKRAPRKTWWGVWHNDIWWGWNHQWTCMARGLHTPTPRHGISHFWPKPQRVCNWSTNIPGRRWSLEEHLSKPHIWYTSHQIKDLQMKDPSLALIINKLQKDTQPQQPLPNTYFLNTDSVLYCCVREGSQGFEAIVVPKKLYQLVLTLCHDLLGHNGTMRLYGCIRRFYFWQKLKAKLY